MEKWQQEWTTSCRAATTRQYFPMVKERIASKLRLTPKMTAVLTGQGMIKAHLHCFHLAEDAKCYCSNEYQTMDHLLFQCPKLNTQ